MFGPYTTLPDSSLKGVQDSPRPLEGSGVPGPSCSHESSYSLCGDHDRRLPVRLEQGLAPSQGGGCMGPGSVASLNELERIEGNTSNLDSFLLSPFRQVCQGPVRQQDSPGLSEESWFIGFPSPPGSVSEEP